MGHRGWSIRPSPVSRGPSGTGDGGTNIRLYPWHPNRGARQRSRISSRRASVTGIRTVIEPLPRATTLTGTARSVVGS